MQSMHNPGLLSYSLYNDVNLKKIHKNISALDIGNTTSQQEIKTEWKQKRDWGKQAAKLIVKG